jgi:hypothetical protein
LFEFRLFYAENRQFTSGLDDIFKIPDPSCCERVFIKRRVSKKKVLSDYSMFENIRNSTYSEDQAIDRVNHWTTAWRICYFDYHTIIPTVQPSSNDFGEFLFVTTSRPSAKDQLAITLYGLGYHEHRERWITRKWFW